MKIRADFVTNSSSSSFVCFGKEVDVEELKKIFKLEENDYDGRYDIAERIENKKFSKVLSTCCNENVVYDDTKIFVGISPETLRTEFSDRPLGEIRKIVSEELNRVGIQATESDIDYIEVGWRDG